MKEFILIFRMDLTTSGAQPSPEQMKQYMSSWDQWVNEIALSGQLLGGQHFSPKGKMISTNKSVLDSPYVASKQSIAGYLTITTKSITGAVSIAKKCPILNGKNTSVEIREIEQQ